MASRISFYCAVFFSMLLYDTSEALNCYTQTSCSGAGCPCGVTTDLVNTKCPAVFDACLRATWEVTVNGDKANYTRLGCGVDPGLGIGCHSYDDLPPFIAETFVERSGFDSFEYCLCDQNLCHTGSSNKGSSNTGSVTATSTLPVIIGSLLFTLLAFPSQV